MRKTRSALCALLIFALLCTFVACGKAPSPAAPKDETADAPADSPAPSPEPSIEPEPISSPDEGLTPDSFVLINEVDQVLDRPHEIQPGSVVTLHAHDVPAYTPWYATTETWLLTNIYEGLVCRYMDRPDDIRPLIAESWSVSEDHLTWTFQIRKDIKFTDGTVCDAPAISASWDHYNSVSQATFAVLNIVFWDAESDYEFTVQLSSPCAYFESAVSEIYIVSPAALALYGPDDERAAVGTAPYYLSETTFDSSVNYRYHSEFIFLANPDYYLYERMPVIETIICKTADSEETKMELFLNGELSGVSFSSVSEYHKLQNNGFDGTLLRGYGNCMPLFLNASKLAQFQIFEVRKAINRLIDLEAVNDELYDGYGLVSTSIWSSDSTGEVPWPEGFYHNEQEGLALLAAAGIDPNEFSFETKVGFTSTAYYEIISKQLAKVGITFSFIEEQPEMSSTFLMRRDWTITNGNSGYTNSRPFLPWTFILLPEHFIRMIWTDAYDPALYETMCSEYEAMVSSSTWDEMLTHCKSLTDMVQRDYAAMPGVQAPYFAAFNKELKGIVLIGENHTLLWNYLYY